MTATRSPAQTAFDHLVEVLQKHGCTMVMRGDDRVSAQCPAHEDRLPSLSVKRISGQALVFCHAGCDTSEVVAALGLSMRDLYDTGTGVDYRYDNGRVVHRLPNKTFPQSNTDRAPELYRLAKVRAAVAEGRPVFVVEGEKDVHAIEALGLTATCAPMGAGKWSKVDPSPLFGGAVLIVADQDEPGAAHADDIFTSLDGRAASVRIFRPKVGKDVADHIAAGYDVGDLIATLPRSAAAPLAGLDLNRLSDPPTEPDWLVRDRIARGWLVLLGAKPGVGKTWLADALAVAMPTGSPWLGHEIPKAGRVLYLDAENGEDLALERLRQLGATADDLGGRLHYVTEPVVLPNAEDVARLRSTIDQFGPDLVIVDTLASVAPSAEKDTESAAAFYAAVWSLVRQAGASLLLLVHLRKSLQGAGKDDQLDAFRGAGHLVGAAHRAWTLEPIATDRPLFAMHDVKARRGHKLPTMRVEVVDDEDGDELRTSVEVLGTVAEVESGYDAFVANVLLYLDNTTLGEGATKDLVGLPDAPPQRTAKAYLTRAIASGVLHKRRHGFYGRAGQQLPAGSVSEGSA